MAVFFGWIIFSFVAGSIGSDRKIGFWPAFLLSLILSPLVGLIVAFASSKNEDERYKKAILETQRKQKEALEQMQQSPLSVAEQISKLADLKDKGILTQDEFEIQKQKILNS